MKYNGILLINHLKINASLLSEPRQNLSFHARPEDILSQSDFYKFSHLCPRANNWGSLCYGKRAKNNSTRGAMDHQERPIHWQSIKRNVFFLLIIYSFRKCITHQIFKNHIVKHETEISFFCKLLCLKIGLIRWSEISCRCQIGPPNGTKIFLYIILLSMLKNIKGIH